MSNHPIDVEAIRALAQILADTGLTEIEIESGNSRIRIARTPAAVGGYAPPSVSAAAPAPSVGAAGAPVPDHPGTVTSPMVGVAYLSAEPGSPPYVSVGQVVTIGQTLLLIEAMKTYNQIRAPHAGTVTRILVATGVPVEFGEALLVIA